jgi:nitrate/nitrite transport system substrate-binding protein
MADELGSYAKHGLAPNLRRGVSPIELRDQLLTGELLAAQVPASFPLALTTQQSAVPDLVTLMVLSQNGAAVTLGRDLCQGVKFLDLAGMRDALLEHASGGKIVLAVPAIGGTDDLLLRYLLGAAGLSFKRVQIVAAPPERMLADLREERIVGFAAPDPWPALAALQDIGFTFATAQDISRTAPQSALVTTPQALAQHRPELKALVRAAIEASVWLDAAANRARTTVGDVLSRRQHLDVDAVPIRARLGSVYDLGCRLGERDFEDDMLWFHHAGRVNLPRRADALLSLALLMRFGLVPVTTDPRVVDNIIRDDLYREVAREMGVPLPDDMKPFVITLDSVRFDPNLPREWPRLWGSG